MIDEIKQALAKATPGEWYLNDEDESTCIMAIDPTSPGRSESVVGFDPEIHFNNEDAEILTFAPEWLRYLIGEVERLQIENIRWLESISTLSTIGANEMRKREELQKALTQISEYWNRDQNEQAMTDACWKVIEIAEEALKEGE